MPEMSFAYCLAAAARCVAAQTFALLVPLVLSVAEAR